jgi:hypothetical protein
LILPIADQKKANADPSASLRDGRQKGCGMTGKKVGGWQTALLGRSFHFGFPKKKRSNENLLAIKAGDEV